MKLVSFEKENNRAFGIVKDGGIIDVSAASGFAYKSLKEFLEREDVSALERFLDRPVDYSLDAVKFLPVIENPGKILCVGMNYADKRAEFNETNPQPTLFVRFADSQTGHARHVHKPAETQEFDYEGELAVIIGKSCYRVSEEEAAEYIAGYSCYMDGSVRDWQHTWYTAGKNWPRTGAFGPYLTTSQEVGDPQTLAIATYLNGREVQRDNTANMIYRVAFLVSYLSTFTRLAPGDVIITGSPGGVGKKRTPPLFLKDGDLIEVEIEKLGRLSNRVKEAAA